MVGQDSPVLFFVRRFCTTFIFIIYSFLFPELLRFVSFDGCSLVTDSLWSELQLQHEQTWIKVVKIRDLAPLWGCKQSLWRSIWLKAEKEILFTFLDTLNGLFVSVWAVAENDWPVFVPPIFWPQHHCITWRCSPLALMFSVVLGCEELENKASPTTLGLSSGVHVIKAGISMALWHSTSPISTVEFMQIYSVRPWTVSEPGRGAKNIPTVMFLPPQKNMNNRHEQRFDFDCCLSSPILSLLLSKVCCQIPNPDQDDYFLLSPLFPSSVFTFKLMK